MAAFPEAPQRLVQISWSAPKKRPLPLPNISDDAGEEFYVEQKLESEEEDEDRDDEKSRLAPNTKFLGRMVAGLERSNAKTIVASLPICGNQVVSNRAEGEALVRRIATIYGLKVTIEDDVPSLASTDARELLNSKAGDGRELPNSRAGGSHKKIRVRSNAAVVSGDIVDGALVSKSRGQTLTEVDHSDEPSLESRLGGKEVGVPRPQKLASSKIHKQSPITVALPSPKMPDKKTSTISSRLGVSTDGSSGDGSHYPKSRRGQVAGGSTRSRPMHPLLSRAISAAVARTPSKKHENAKK
mmetsp:Transcript_12877/g.25409  ORF Transcript_12877/g.25409 Transcript_12877/m.25409 type:complete len:299 (-) Transcript_12877:204-1100(-)